MLRRDVSSSAYRDRVVVLKQEPVSTLDDAKCLPRQRIADKELLDGILWPLLSIRPINTNVPRGYQESRKVLADKAVVETKLYKYQADEQARIDQILTFLDDEVKRADDLDSERVGYMSLRRV